MVCSCIAYLRNKRKPTCKIILLTENLKYTYIYKKNQSNIIVAAAWFISVQECYPMKHCQPQDSVPLLGMFDSCLKTVSVHCQFFHLHMNNPGSLSYFPHLFEQQLILSPYQYCCHSPCDLNLQQTDTSSLTLLCPTQSADFILKWLWMKHQCFVKIYSNRKWDTIFYFHFTTQLHTAIPNEQATLQWQTEW
jgi:hypothetical protein